MAQQQAPSPKARIAQRIRSQSSRGHFVTVEELTEPPFTFTEDAALANLEAMAADERYQDIQWIQGSKGSYLYSNQNMTENFARLQVHVTEKNILAMVAEAVRHDSSTYPRPTDIGALRYKPYNLEQDFLDEVLKEIQENGEYADIQQITASTGVRYLYSNKFLQPRRAQALVELREVLEDE